MCNMLCIQNCSQCPSESIQEQLEVMKGEFIASFASVMGKEYQNLGTRRFQLALRLYYRELEALLKLVSGMYIRGDTGCWNKYDVWASGYV